MNLVSRYLTGSLLLVVGLLTAAVTQAQPPQGPQLSAEQMQQIQGLREQGLQIQKKVSALQQQAVQGSPALQQQSREMQEMGNTIMKSQGVDIEKSVARLQEMKGEFSKEGITDEQKKKLQQEALEISQKLEQAQAATMSDPKVQQAAAKMEKDLIAEMTKLDPTVPEMLKKLDGLDQQIRQIVMAAQGKK
mgnify:CR=1 FL=1